MRKRSWVTLVAVLAGLSFSLTAVGYAQAQTPAMSGPTAGLPKPAAGAVVKADSATKTLVIKPEGKNTKDMTFTVKDTVAGHLASLKPGQKVMVHFVDRGGGKLEVESIAQP
jgi:Cu/Ag efflux protein CusF